MPNIYMIAGVQPVKQVENEDGGVGFFVWDWKKNDFVRDMVNGYDMIRGFEPGSDGLDYATDYEIVTQQRFEEYVEELRQKKIKEKFVWKDLDLTRLK